VTVVLSVYILAPKQNLVFAVQGSEVYEYFAGRGGDIAETHRTLAYWIGTARERNDVVVEQLYRSFSAACSALVVQVVVWVAALGGTLG
jgi:hypothetical protein